MIKERAGPTSSFPPDFGRMELSQEKDQAQENPDPSQKRQTGNTPRQTEDHGRQSR